MFKRQQYRCTVQNLLVKSQPLPGFTQSFRLGIFKLDFGVAAGWFNRSQCSPCYTVTEQINDHKAVTTAFLGQNYRMGCNITIGHRDFDTAERSVLK